MNEELISAVEADQELTEGLLDLIGGRVSKSPRGLEGTAGPAGDLLAAAAGDRGLEAIVERHGRPSLFIFDGMYEPPSSPPGPTAWRRPWPRSGSPSPPPAGSRSRASPPATWARPG